MASSPVGTAFANHYPHKQGTNLLAVLEPNVAVKPLDGDDAGYHAKDEMTRSNVVAQAAVAKAVADAVGRRHHSKDPNEDLVCVCGVFIHPAAEDDEKIYSYNYTSDQAIAYPTRWAVNPLRMKCTEKKDSVTISTKVSRQRFHKRSK